VCKIKADIPVGEREGAFWSDVSAMLHGAYAASVRVSCDAVTPTTSMRANKSHALT
jgi:hypothetical protein